MKTFEILDINIFADSKNKFIDLLNENLNSSNQVSTVNAEFLVESTKNPLFKDILKKSEFCLPDGISVRASAWILDKKRPKLKFFRQIYCIYLIIIAGIKIIFNQKSFNQIPYLLSGADIFWDLIDFANKHKLSVYFLGGTERSLTKTIERVNKRHPGLKIAGSSFASSEDTDLPENISKTNPDILFVAFGAPKQEIFLSANKRKINYKIGIGVGGTFDFISGVRIRAPKFIRHIGLEWLWRLFQEPKRFPRIIRATIIFPYHIFKRFVSNS